MVPDQCRPVRAQVHQEEYILDDLDRWFENNLKHLIPIGITTISTIFIGVFKWYGLTQLGFCSVTSTRNSDLQIYFPIVQLSFSLAFVGFALFAYRYHRRYMP